MAVYYSTQDGLPFSTFRQCRIQTGAERVNDEECRPVGSRIACFWSLPRPVCQHRNLDSMLWPRATASPQPVPTLDSGTNAPTAAPALPTPAATGGSTGSETAAPLGENVAAAGHAVPSSGEESAHLAIDGDLDSLWNSNRVPLGWFTLAFDDFYLVDRVELVIAQTPRRPNDA